MKIGYLTDIHARAENPIGRTDNFNKSLFLKLEECGELFKDCDIVLCGGDWGDRPDIPYSVYNDLAKMLKSWNKPILGIIGSHDYYGYEVKSLKRTAVGALVASGVVELIGSAGMDSAIQFKDVVICGTPHTFWLDDKPENYYHPRYSSSLQIQLTHGSLLENSAPFQHTLLSDVRTESDIVLGAHYHPGWKKIHKLREKVFLHPGAIARLDNTGVSRIPAIAIIDTAYSFTDVDKCFSIIPLSTAILHPFKDKVKELVDEIPTSLVNKVLDMIQATQVNMIDIKKQLPLVAKELGYDRIEILEEAFNLIELAEKEK